MAAEHVSNRRVFGWLWVCLLVLVTPVHAGNVRLKFAEAVLPGLTLQDVRLDFGLGGGAGGLHVALLQAGGREWQDVALECMALAFEARALVCRGGRISAGGASLLDGLEAVYDLDSRRGRIDLVLSEGGAVRAEFDAATGQAHVAFESLSPALLSRWVVLPEGVTPVGSVTGVLEYGPSVVDTAGGASIRLDADVAGLRFSTADGLQAMEDAGIKVHAVAGEEGGRWQVSGRAHWHAGEAYFHPLYMTAGPALVFAFSLSPETLVADRLSLELEGVDTLEARAVWSLSEQRFTEGALVVARADLGVVGPRFLAPILAPARADTLRFEGRVSAGLVLEEGDLKSADLAFEDAYVGLSSGDLGFGPVTGALPWRRDATTQVSLDIGGGQWQRLALDAFRLEAELSGTSVRVPEVSIPVLDGRVRFSDLALSRASAGWSGSGAVVVEPISMALLTDAIGLPVMSGVLSASLPGLTVRPGEVRLEGALVMSVFSGYLQVTDLWVLEPFGTASHLYASVEARNLDLFQLTEAFSFGSMQGFIDLDVRDLELARWQPVRFDAVLRSSPGRYSRRISQRAVQNIGALGGPGASLAIQRGVLSFFDSFGYSELGLRCRLRGGVCEMGGIEPAAETANQGFTIVRGGGIPSLNVMGYNRRVDWRELVERIQRVIESNTSPVIN